MLGSFFVIVIMPSMASPGLDFPMKSHVPLFGFRSRNSGLLKSGRSGPVDSLDSHVFGNIISRESPNMIRNALNTLWGNHLNRTTIAKLQVHYLKQGVIV